MSEPNSQNPLDIYLDNEDVILADDVEDGSAALFLPASMWSVAKMEVLCRLSTRHMIFSMPVRNPQKRMVIPCKFYVEITPHLISTFESRSKIIACSLHDLFSDQEPITRDITFSCKQISASLNP